MFAYEELTKLVTCGSDAERSTARSLPCFVTAARRHAPGDAAGECDEAPLARARRADHGVEIAAEVARMAHVGDEHFDHVAPRGAALGDFERRDAQSLVPDFRGGGVEIAAEVARMAHVGDEHFDHVAP